MENFILIFYFFFLQTQSKVPKSFFGKSKNPEKKKTLFLFFLFFCCIQNLNPTIHYIRTTILESSNFNLKDGTYICNWICLIDGFQIDGFSN